MGDDVPLYTRRTYIYRTLNRPLRADMLLNLTTDCQNYYANSCIVGIFFLNVKLTFGLLKFL